MRKILLIVLLGISSFVSAKEDINTYWQKANKAYQQKEYGTAIDLYEKIAAGKPKNAVVYYNLGNAYYKQNNITLAILNYERALAANPGYKEAEDNLSIAQSRIINRLPQTQDIFFIRWWKAITSSATASLWAIAALFIFLGLIVINTLKKLRKLPFHMPGQGFAASWATLAVLLVLAFTSAKRASGSNKAVITQTESAFYISPQQTKPSLYIPEGTTVKCDDQIREWTNITLPDGREGWVRTNTITKI